MFIIYIFLVLSSAIIDSNGLGMAQKLEPIGGKGGKQWDDGTDYDSVTKVHIRAGGGRKGIQAIQFNYVKDGKPINGSIHGDSRAGFTHTLEIDRSKSEYIVSVDCYYDGQKGITHALQFITNLKTSELIGYPKGTKKSSLRVEGKIINGFHGFAKKYLYSLGAYVTTLASPPVKSPPPPPVKSPPPPIKYAPPFASPPVNYAPPPVNYAPPPVKYAPPPVNYALPPINYAPPPVNYAPAPSPGKSRVKSELVGGFYYGSDFWDDGPNYDGIRKISVTYTDAFIRSISTEYEKDGKVISSNHGNKDGETQEFVIDYPNEYLISVQGTCGNFPHETYKVITALSFRLSSGRMSPIYGMGGSQFSLDQGPSFPSPPSFQFNFEGPAIVGFHGRESDVLDAIGVYYTV